MSIHTLIKSQSSAQLSSLPQSSDEDKTNLTKYLGTVDKALGSSSQLDKVGASNDKAILPDLIKLANAKHPGLNAQYFEAPHEMAEAIEKMINEGMTSARFVVNMGSDGTHFAAFDFTMVNGKASVIGVEPATTQGAMGPALLAMRAKSAFQHRLPDVPVVIIESDLQRSNGECGMFSLNLAKKMHSERETFLNLHQSSLTGALEVKSGLLIDKAGSNQVLPPSMMKHSQSEKRLEAYLEARPEARDLPVTKDGKTLKDRQKEYLVELEDEGKTRKYSQSIEMKRKTEIMRLLEAAEKASS